MDDVFSLVPNAMDVRGHLPHPKWETISAWVEENVDPPSHDEAWKSIVHQWLVRLGDALSPDYAVYESDEFVLLSSDASLAPRVLDLCERSRRIILETLNGVAQDEGFGKHVVLIFGESDRYYDYVSEFYPDEGEFGLSGGMFFDSGYGHFVVSPGHGVELDRVIAHELNHALLRHLPLPLWLDEGVTQFMEDVVLESSYFFVDHQLVRLHREYWNKENIQSFWSGESFILSDDGQQLSYHLAQVLFRNLMADHSKKVREILLQANSRDAGNAAFVNVLGQTLADRVAQFLGSGPWSTLSDYGAEDASI
ncbi:MAG: hypothetical protein NXI28_23650 [bacterium]|nr:hypothetical protein [bacterium]